jgi:hypothetical protein
MFCLSHRTIFVRVEWGGGETYHDQVKAPSRCHGHSLIVSERRGHNVAILFQHARASFQKTGVISDLQNGYPILALSIDSTRFPLSSKRQYTPPFPATSN